VLEAFLRQIPSLGESDGIIPYAVEAVDAQGKEGGRVRALMTREGPLRYRVASLEWPFGI
jgi:hypothetical protein